VEVWDHEARLTPTFSTDIFYWGACYKPENERWSFFFGFACFYDFWTCSDCVAYLVFHCKCWKYMLLCG